MSSGLKLIIPGAVALYLASACAPDLDSLSAAYSASSVAGTSGNSSSGDGGGADTSSGGSGSGNGNGGAPVALPVCANNKKDSNESDVDCGGTSKCDRCATNSTCTANRDCDKDFCKSGHCVDPTCTDKVMNQDETGVDCGGSCKPCDIGVPCSENSDCTGQYCLKGKCADHCLSGVTEADETDTDCGGATCDPCADKLGCAEAADCKSLICSNQKCQAPTCSDQVKNQDESDKDCGGVCAATKPCPTGALCNGPADCASWICSTAGKCLEDTVVVAPGAMIDDFEDGDFLLPALGTPARVGNWYVYSDLTTGGVTTEDIFPIKRGASLSGLHTVGKGFTNWGSGVGVDLNNGGTKLPYDASAFGGITFWGRAETSLVVTVALPDIDTDNLTTGKTCTTCDHHYLKSVTFGTAWQRFTFAWSELTLEPGGAPTPVPAFKPGALSSVQFRFAPGQTYDVYLDDVGFVSK